MAHLRILYTILVVISQHNRKKLKNFYQKGKAGICAELGTKTRTKWHNSRFYLFLRLLMVVILLV